VPPKHEYGGKKRPQNHKVGAESAPAQIRAEKVWRQKVPSKCKSGGKKRHHSNQSEKSHGGVKSKFVCKFIFQLCGFTYATFIFKRFD